MGYGWNLELVRKRDVCQFIYIPNTWANKSVWNYSIGMLLQDVTLLPVSMVTGTKLLGMWGAFLEITDVLARLLLGSADIVDEDLTLIERFFVLLYDRTGSTASTNGARRLLFKNKGKSIGNCPPTLNALLQHI